MHRRRCAILALLLLVGLAPFVDVSPAAAATDVYTVTTTTDVVDAGDDQLSLREAVSLAGTDAGDSEIVLASGATYDLTICNPSPPEHSNVDGDVDLPADDAGVTITGNGATIHQTCADERVLLTQQPITLRHVTISGGDTPPGCCGESNGGGVYAYEDVTVEDSTFTDNDASSGASVYVGGDVEVVRSTFTANTSSSGGPGVTAVSATSDVVVADSTFHGNTGGANGAFHSTGTLTLRNTTITANTTTTVNTFAALLSGNTGVTLEHVTVAGNTMAEGESVTGATIDLTDSIVATDGFDECVDTAVVTTHGGNVLGDGSCGTPDATDTIAADPQLEALAQNGGPTLTRRPAATSPAIGTDPAPCGTTLTTDQRGVGRPQGSACDAGAVEVGIAPDGLVRRIDGTFVGDGVHNLTGAGQTRTVVVQRGHTARFQLRADNDSEVADTLVVRGPAGRGRVLARYYVAGQDRTASVVAGRAFPRQPGGHAFVGVRIRVAADAPHGLVRSFVLRTRSTLGQVEDRVIARVRVA